MAPKPKAPKPKAPFKSASSLELDETQESDKAFKKAVTEPLGKAKDTFRKAVSLLRFGARIAKEAEPAADESSKENAEEGTSSLKPPGRSSYSSAEIAFDGGTSPYCLISHNSMPEELFDSVIQPADGKDWGLRTPNLILSIMGGAGNMHLSDKFDIACFSKGLVEAATRTCAWVITGGTASGVMDIVGKAMQKYDKQRQVPCIGISPFGALSTKWLDLLEKQMKDHDKKVDAADAQTAGLEEGPALQDNHSHFIICDNGKVGKKAFGSEIEFRTRFEESLAKGSVPAREAPVQVPRVMILVNGGKISLKSLVEAIRTGCPLVVCQGTGRVADVICSILEIMKNRPVTELHVEWASDWANDLKKKVQGNYSILTWQGTPLREECAGELATIPPKNNFPLRIRFEGSESDTEVSPGAEFEKLLQAAVEDFMQGETLTKDEIDNTYEIVKSGKVEIYSVNDRLEDVILRAVLGNNRSISSSPTSAPAGVSVWQQLALAVQWGCKDYYDDIGKRLIQERGGHEKGPPEAIRLIFQELVAFGWHKHRDGWRQAETETPINIVKNVRENAGSLVAWLLQHYLKQMKDFKVENLDFHIKWNRSGHQEPWESLEGLLLWSIEQEAPSSLLEIIWSYMEDPVHAALVAASACRQTAERERGSGSYHDCLAKKELEEAGERFEKLAVKVMEDLAQTGKGVKYLFQDSERWKVGTQGRTWNCFKLAHELGCNMFVSESFYRQAVDLYWKRPVPFDVTKDQLNTKSLSWWEFLSIPSSQAWTHGISRGLFVGLYSYAVFYRLLTFGGISLTEVLLFFWGLGLGYVEIKQLNSSGFQAHFRDLWNWLDAIYIILLLGTLVFGVALAHKNEDLNEGSTTPEIIHAMNLLPCWIRVLQALQLNESLGVLLITIFGMAKDAIQFFILVVIFCFGFSCAITPILFSSGVEREEQGLTWAFWTIVGNLDEKALNKLNTLTGLTRFVAVVLVYTLALVCNVLLVNLLIAVMNSTYEKNQAMSQTQWAINRVEAVLEFDHESILPPPLNLLEPFFNPSIGANNKDANGHGPKTPNVLATRRDPHLKDAQQRAFLAITLEEETGESAQLRAEVEALRRRNNELSQRNKDLEALAANFLLERNTTDPNPPSPKTGGLPLIRKPRRMTTTPLTSPVG